MKNCCMNCDYCDKRRKNAIGMPRCKQHNMFVAPDDCCDFHRNNGVIEKELWTKRKEVVDEDNLTQNQRGISELKPCPKCGARAFIHRDAPDDYFMGYSAGCPRYCINDGIHGISTVEQHEEKGYAVHGYFTKQEAINAWNRRATDERK